MPLDGLDKAALDRHIEREQDDDVIDGGIDDDGNFVGDDGIPVPYDPDKHNTGGFGGELGDPSPDPLQWVWDEAERRGCDVAIRIVKKIEECEPGDIVLKHLPPIPSSKTKRGTQIARFEER